MTDPDADEFIRGLRRELTDLDRGIVEAINSRLELVARLKAYKESRGLGFVDPDREEWMLQYLARANSGPLSPGGLEEIYKQVLALTKRELGNP